MEPEDYFGKRALIGINHLSPDGTLKRRSQVHGTIVAVDHRGWLVLDRADGEGQMSIPSQLEPAKPGEYTLASTGEVVVDPDYVAVWSVTEVPPPENLPDA